MLKYILPLFISSLFYLQAEALIIHVPGDYTTIQGAINASSNGDTILVEPGTYFENINFRGKKVVLTSRFYITNDPSTIWATVINGSTPSQPDSGSCVIISNHEDSTTVLQGFTITGGSGTKWQDEHGAGRYREGGGILIQYSSPVIQFNIIHNNQVTDITGVVSTGGGGMRVGDSYPRIYNNIIMNNTGRYGAGLVLNYTGGEVKNNIICVNYGSYQYGSGSGIWLNGAFTRPITIINNTVVNNTATTGTPGIYGFGGVQASFRNNIVWGNISPGGSQISGGSFTINYCDVQGGYTGAGNINADPLFADTNYILSNSSLCIDAGDSSTIYNDPEDPLNPGFAKWPSKGTIRNDMGAYGGPLRRILSNTPIGIRQTGFQVPSRFVLYQNYPNPFNPNTKIRFEVPSVGAYRNTPLQIIVYDILGKEVEMLINEQMQPGSYEAEWNGSNYTSGVYFYKLTVCDFTEVKKMILVK